MKFLIILLFTFNIYAVEVFEVPSFNLEIKSENIISKIQSAINNPEGVLKRFSPIGGAIKNKSVSHNEVRFTMTKRVLIITKTFNVKFTVDINEVEGICKKGLVGYAYSVDLMGSDDLVTDNIEKLDFEICIKENSKSNATAFVSGRLIKGKNYSEPIGSIAKNTIQDQVDPFVAAIKDEVMNSIY